MKILKWAQDKQAEYCNQDSVRELIAKKKKKCLWEQLCLHR